MQKIKNTLKKVSIKSAILLLCCIVLSWTKAPEIEPAKSDIISLESASDALISEAFYFEPLDAIITITYEENTKKVVSLTDSSNSLSEEFIASVIAKINNGSGAVSDCGCAWWNVVCQGYCALCEGLTGEDCYFN